MVAGKFTPNPTLVHKYFLCSAYTSPQLVAIETASRGQAFCKFLKVFYNTPSLIQRNSEGSCTTKKRTVYKLFTSPLYYICRFRVGLHNRSSQRFTNCSRIFYQLNCSPNEQLANNFSFPLYLSKGIFYGYFASFGKDFNIRSDKLIAYSRRIFTTQRCSLLTPLEKNFII